jgi:hypothetical protein
MIDVLEIKLIKKESYKTMIITKPTNWNWEFTVVSEDQKKLDDQKMRDMVKTQRMAQSYENKTLFEVQFNCSNFRTV